MTVLHLNVIILIVLIYKPIYILTFNTVQNAKFGELLFGNVSFGNEVRYLYRYVEKINQTQAVRIHVYSPNAREDYPLLVVIRQQREILSFQIPLNLDRKQSYNNVSRTLCPVESSLKLKQDHEQIIFVDISTNLNSSKLAQFYFKAEMLTDFELRLDSPRPIQLTPAEPQYFLFNFPPGVEAVTLEVSSNDNSCLTLSVHNVHCPVYDLLRHGKFSGIYQTITTKGAMVVSKSDFDTESFYAVLVLRPTNRECSISTYQTLNPSKKLTINVLKILARDEYYLPIIGPIVFFLCFYIVAGGIALAYYYLGRNRSRNLGNMEDSVIGASPIKTDYAHYGAAATEDPWENPSTNGLVVKPQTLEMLNDEDIEDETHSNVTSDLNKSTLFLSDLARKKGTVLSQKYKFYYWYLIIIAIFYGLPVIQLVITYQKVVHLTGNEDICYYNFLCSRQLGLLTAFNNVFSNVGFIMLGILFLGITFRRDLLSQYTQELSETYEQYTDTTLNKKVGIPHYYGLFYAMGIALIMEGILSGCYHVCPSYSNFQFDTAFMYILACLCMLKIYQIRHPDINASAHAAYMTMAIVIFVGVVGVVYGNGLFWFLFTLIFILMSIFLTAEVYYMGRWQLDRQLPSRLYGIWRANGIWQLFRPTYRDRMILLLVANCVNFILAIYGAARQPRDFSSFLLAIFMINLLMYCAFYLIMKYRSGERFLFLPLMYILVACLTWSLAIYFFVQLSSSWELTPADSRALNQPCILLDFYDVHDVWHFLSSMSMFFSFMALMNIDDDLIHTPRDSIPVF